MRCMYCALQLRVVFGRRVLWNLIQTMPVTIPVFGHRGSHNILSILNRHERAASYYTKISLLALSPSP